MTSKAEHGEAGKGVKSAADGTRASLLDRVMEKLTRPKTFRLPSGVRVISLCAESSVDSEALANGIAARLQRTFHLVEFGESPGHPNTASSAIASSPASASTAASSAPPTTYPATAPAPSATPSSTLCSAAFPSPEKDRATSFYDSNSSPAKLCASLIARETVVLLRLPPVPFDTAAADVPADLDAIQKLMFDRETKSDAIILVEVARLALQAATSANSLTLIGAPKWTKSLLDAAALSWLVKSKSCELRSSHDFCSAAAVLLGADTLPSLHCHVLSLLNLATLFLVVPKVRLVCPNRFRPSLAS